MVAGPLNSAGFFGALAAKADKAAKSRSTVEMDFMPESITPDERASEEGWCPGPDSNRHAPFGAADFKSAASTNSATGACLSHGNIAKSVDQRCNGNCAGAAVRHARFSFAVDQRIGW